MQPSTDRFLKQLRREIRRGILPLWVIEQLASGPEYGYSLLEKLKVHHGADISVGPSTLYPTLARLRSAGLVRIFHGTTSLGPLRKYYELTDQGHELLPLLRELWTSASTIPTARSSATSSVRGTTG